MQGTLASRRLATPPPPNPETPMHQDLVLGINESPSSPRKYRTLVPSRDSRGRMVHTQQSIGLIRQKYERDLQDAITRVTSFEKGTTFQDILLANQGFEEENVDELEYAKASGDLARDSKAKEMVTRIAEQIGWEETLQHLVVSINWGGGPT